MSTFEEIGNHVVVEAGLEAFGISPEFVLVRWIKSRYRQIINAMPFGNINQQGDSIITTNPKIDDGLVTVSNGSQSVSGIGTGWTSDLISRSFRVGSTTGWYQIIDVSGQFDLLLDTGFADSSRSSTGYSIGQRYYVLGSNLRWITHAKNTSRNLPITWLSRGKLDELFPSRPSMPSVPQYAAPAGFDPVTGRRIIELYPFADSTYRIEFSGYANIDEPVFGGSPLPDIDDQVIIEGCLADALKYRAANDPNMTIERIRGFLDLASSHERRFNELKDDLSQRDSFDAPKHPVKLIIDRGQYGHREIMTAEDEIAQRSPIYG